MNDCIRNKAGILIGLFTLLGCFAIRAQDIAVKTNLLYGGLLQTPNIGVEWGISPKLTVDLWESTILFLWVRMVMVPTIEK